MIIFLADLQNSYYRLIRNSVPIGMGYVAAYLKKEFGDAVEIHQFRKFEELHDALKHKTPQLVAFGSYSWNSQLTIKAARWLRPRLPEAIITVGGPDVSEVVPLTVQELQAHPEVDFYMPNEGEEPTRHLVEALLGGSAQEVRRRAIHGCLSRDRETGEIRGDVIARFERDINEIPSPYLDGLMDSFLAKDDYLPIIQTARGCPYQCTFCVSGKDSWNKVKAFSMDRVRAEVDYIERRAANRFLRLADENFGILHRDIQIAEYLMEKQKQTGFPTAVSVYTDKHPTDRVKSINLLMRDLMPFNISYQSTTDEVLANIKRVNLKDARVEDAVKFARENELMLVSELIFALPGETVESFLASIDRLLDYRFESIAINQLRILKGTEMDHPEDRRKYGVRTMFSMSENGYTNHSELENIEIDEWVIENNTLTRDEYFETNKLLFLFGFAHYRGYLREILFFFMALGVPMTRILQRVVRDAVRFPTTYARAERFIRDMQSFLRPTPEDVVAFVRERMTNNPHEVEGIYRHADRLMIEILMGPEFQQVVEDLALAGRDLYEQEHGAFTKSLEEQLELIKQVVVLSRIPLDRPSPVELGLEAPYDLAAWVRERYSRPLEAYRSSQPIKTGLRVRNPQAYAALWKSDRDTLFERHKRHFLTFNSSNRRRFIVRASEEAVAISSVRVLTA